MPYYEHAGITIYHGDCRDVLPTLGRVDLVLTDPPYGIGFPSAPTQYRRRAGAVAEHWDTEAPSDVVVGLLGICDNVCIWGGNYFNLPITRSWIAWVKPDGPPSFSKLEMAWTSASKPAKYVSQSISATNKERLGHPTQKPMPVIKFSIDYMGAEAGQLILDPFMGSGTTLRVSKDMGIRAIGIEREEKYCEMAANRLAQEVLF